VLKSLKGKISLVYLSLVLLIAAVGVTSVFNLYKLGKSINGLMINNYKSISAVNKMVEALEEQNSSILKYIYSNRQEGIKEFHYCSSMFYKWFNIEYNNVTEIGEREYNDKINDYYIQYVKLFSELQEIKTTHGEAQGIKFYNANIMPLYSKLKNELKNVSSLNEKAMFNSKERITKDTRRYLIAILTFSTVAVIGGFLLSSFFINKFLKPISLLTETMKSVKEGDLYKQAPISSNDEIGDLAHEFNNMTKRLQEFEQSTKGSLLIEKNRSLAIVKSIPDPLIVLDTNYKIIFLNSASERFFNIKEENVIGKHFLEGIRNGELFDYISSIYQGKEEQSERIVHFQLDDEDYYFNIIVNGIKDKNAKLNGVVALLQNVTQLKQLEKVKNDFMSTISHELKTPLTSIMIGTSLLMDENIGKLNQKQMEIIEAIKEDGERLSSLITNLLQLARLQSDKAIFNFEKCSIEDIILNSVKNFHEQAKNKDVNLYYIADESLPRVNADFEKITWVINNLLSNALKYTSSKVEISVKAFIKDNKMHVSVKDTGIGIPQEYQDKIFDRFVQVNEFSSEMEGTGLGLAIAREIIEAHGGEIWCESELHHGCNFTFTLPLA
jgi:PAS domain S-box-containing protein